MGISLIKYFVSREGMHDIVEQINLYMEGENLKVIKIQIVDNEPNETEGHQFGTYSAIVIFEYAKEDGI